MTPVFTYMLETGLGLAAFYGIFAFFLRKETYFRLNRLFLVGGLFLSFLIPAFPIASPFRTAPAPALSGSADFPFESAPSLDAFGVLSILYAAGVLVFLVRFGGHLARLGGVVRRRGIRRLQGLRIVAVEREFSPFSFLGLVFVNEGLAGQGNLRRILAHERVHIRQFHSLDVLLMEVVLSLQWFNPFVWPYKKALQETHEYLADAGVIAQGFGSLRYQRLMFEQHVGARLFEFGNDFKQSQIKRRISMLGKIPSPPAAKLKTLLALPLALALVLVFAQPRAAASAAPGLQDKTVQTDPAKKEKITRAEKEMAEISEAAAEIKMKLDSTVDESVKTELKKKFEALIQRKQELDAFLGGSSAQLKMKTDSAVQEKIIAELLKELDMKEEAAKSELEKSADASKKTELKNILEKIHQERAELIAESKGGEPVHAKFNPEMLEKMLAELKAKENDVRAELGKTEDVGKKAELEKLLKKIARKSEDVKAKIADAKTAVKDARPDKSIR
jgi:hypothetical protein